LDTSGSSSEIPGKNCDVVLEKDGEENQQGLTLGGTQQFVVYTAYTNLGCRAKTSIQ
jgi:hypothetical protein